MMESTRRKGGKRKKDLILILYEHDWVGLFV